MVARAWHWVEKVQSMRNSSPETSASISSRWDRGVTPLRVRPLGAVL